MRITRFEARAFVILLCAFALGCTVTTLLSILIGVPIVRWVVAGQLSFSTEWINFVHIGWFIFGMTLVMTLLTWVDGKRRGIWVS